MHASIRDEVSLWTHYLRPSLTYLEQKKGSEKTLNMSETQVERVTSRSKPLFALLLVESNTSKEAKPMHHFAESLLRDFKGVFLNYLSSELPTLREIKN